MSLKISEISKIGWKFDNTYVRLPNPMLSKISPVPVKSPKIAILNKTLAKELGLDFSSISNKNLAHVFSGNILPEGSKSIAQAYAGHQFGHFTMLGDGRAILIGEHINKTNKRFDIQFKGSGVTPYSRNGDGRAALGPMLREYIISEAMFYLNIPTTRSLAVVTTGENVIRETSLTGAILTRVASSHLRVGTFQYAAMLGDLKILKTLVDYSIDRHYPNLKEEKNKTLSLLKSVVQKQTELVVNWMRVGFIHGVMNTDNMTISGETIDYGPCAFMDTYDPETVFSSIDHQGRYAYMNQPGITKWNLFRFAETLIPLIHDDEKKSIEIAKETVGKFSVLYEEYWVNMMRGKIGLFGNHDEDKNLIINLLSWMKKNKADYTNTFYSLMNKKIKEDKFFDNLEFINWYKQWKIRLKKNKKNFEASFNLMKKNNPVVIPRNHNVEKALEDANNNLNLKSVDNLLEVLQKPYIDRSETVSYQKPPISNDKKYKTYCGT
tara:strand:- start:267 stop:1745 length:1479 start_codon:yes stop_codon:yes gene_type:complete